MKTKIAVLLLAIAVPCIALAIDVPLYPGAKINQMLTKGQHDQDKPENEAYTTPDSFEKVCAFYRKLGVEMPQAKTISKDYKATGFNIPGKKFTVSVSWIEKPDLGTMITFLKKGE